MSTSRTAAAILAALALAAAPAARAGEKGCACAHDAPAAAKAAAQGGHEGHAGHAAHATEAATGEADPHAAHRAAAAAAASAPPAPAGAASPIRFPDEPLLDQDGRSRRFASDVLADRIVVLDFVFTTCTTICPVLSGIMSGVQQGIGDAADVALVSVSVDPVRDTPPRLKAYAKKWNAGERWTFLTGERDGVKRVLEAAGAYTADFTSHPPMVLVGDARTGKWVRLNGFPKRAQVLATVEALRAARPAVTASAAEVKP